MALPRLLSQLAQVFLAVPCPLCQRPASSLLCADCYRQMCACQWSSGQAHARHQMPATSKQSELLVFSWGKYQGVLKQLLALLKYGNQAELGFWLGYQLGQQWKTSGLQGTQQPIVVPIPLHRQRLNQRGYNQAALIAKGFCRVTGLSLAENGLRRIKATEAMYHLTANERHKNLIDAFQLGKNLPSQQQPILLIDDIYTTGTTAITAATPLMQAGYRIIGIATVAQAILSSPLAGSVRSDPPH